MQQLAQVGGGGKDELTWAHVREEAGDALLRQPKGEWQRRVVAPLEDADARVDEAEARLPVVEEDLEQWGREEDNALAWRGEVWSGMAGKGRLCSCLGWGSGVQVAGRGIP